MFRALFFSFAVFVSPLAYAESASWSVRYLSSFLASNRVMWAETQALPTSAALRNLADILEHVCQWAPSEKNKQLAKDLRRIARQEDSNLQDRNRLFETVRDSISAYLEKMPDINRLSIESLAAEYHKPVGQLLAEFNKHLHGKTEFENLSDVLSQLEQLYVEGLTTKPEADSSR